MRELVPRWRVRRKYCCNHRVIQKCTNPTRTDYLRLFLGTKQTQYQFGSTIDIEGILLIRWRLDRLDVSEILSISDASYHNIFNHLIFRFLIVVWQCGIFFLCGRGRHSMYHRGRDTMNTDRVRNDSLYSQNCWVDRVLNNALNDEFMPAIKML